MSEPLLSQDWYRVGFMRPRLRGGVRITRQQIRGENWYVLSDPVSGRHHRFNHLAYHFIACCDGERSLDDIWAACAQADGDQVPTQGEAIRIVSQAFAANLFIGDVAPDAAAVVKAQTGARRRRTRAAVNPFAFRIPLWDPDRFLAAHAGTWRWLFQPMAQRLAWAVVIAGALLLALNADSFGREMQAQLGSGRGLLLLWLAYPLIKALHEMAHAFAVKVHGGEVHEIGITLLLLTPVPYVDASASIAFPHKRNRIAVAAAGILVEAVIATVALLLWLMLEPGLARELMFALVLIGGVSTVLINGNPLLRFDGYHALSDALELPNLGLRSPRHWHVLLQRWLLGARRTHVEQPAPGERGWLLAYAPLAWLYRVALTVPLALWAAQWNGTLGVAVLLIAGWVLFAKPAFGALRFIARAPELIGVRLRAAAFTSLALGAALVALFTLPLPSSTHAPGVVWLPDEALVRLGSDGFLEELLVHDGETVQAGAPIARLSNDALRAELERAQALLQQQDVERATLFDTDPLRAAQAEDEIVRLSAERDSLQLRAQQLLVRAGAAGRVVLDPGRNRIGQFLPQGHLLAHVLPGGAPLVRALVRNEDIALVRERPGPISVALAPQAGDYSAALEGNIGQASAALPTAALGDRAGGPIAVDAADPSGLTAREPRFQLSLRLPPGAPATIGARAFVRFGHGDASAADLLARAARQAFLRHFER